MNVFEFPLAFTRHDQLVQTFFSWSVPFFDFKDYVFVLAAQFGIVKRALSGVSDSQFNWHVTIRIRLMICNEILFQQHIFILYKVRRRWQVLLITCKTQHLLAVCCIIHTSCFGHNEVCVSPQDDWLPAQL